MITKSRKQTYVVLALTALLICLLVGIQLYFRAKPVVAPNTPATEVTEKAAQDADATAKAAAQSARSAQQAADSTREAAQQTSRANNDAAKSAEDSRAAADKAVDKNDLKK